MKRTLIAITLAAGLITPALAQHHQGFRHFDHHAHRGGGWGWVAPTIIGGLVGYEIARANQPVYVQPSSVYVQPNPVYVQQAPAYVQYPTVIIDGVTYTRQVMIVNGVTQEVLVRQ
jgi:hypothetical protein